MAQDFSYKDYFQAVTVLEQLMRGDEPRAWLLAMPREPKPAENLVYFGCNVLKTVHLAQTVTRILDALGVDYAAVGGPGFCCGIVHRRMGDLEPAGHLFDHAMGSFETFHPATLINWCPSCEAQLDHMVADRGGLPYRVVHFTEFLRERLGAGGVELRPVPLKVGLHTHTQAGHSDRDSEDAAAVLRLLPGLEVTVLPPHAELLADCGKTGCIRVLGLERYDRLIAGDLERARALGLDAVVSVYHSCHRELCKRLRGEIPVLNYTTLVAMAMGLPLPEDRYQRYVADDDLDSALAALLPRAEALGLRRETAEAVLRRELNIH